MLRLAGLVNTGGWADLKWIDAMCAMAHGLAGDLGGPTGLPYSYRKRWLPFARSNLTGDEIGDDGVINGGSVQVLAHSWLSHLFS